MSIVQGTAGSKFFPPIETALVAARAAAPDNVHIVFKGFASEADSFGCLKYPADYFQERGARPNSSHAPSRMISQRACKPRHGGVGCGTCANRS